jgi:hypothetical protein
MWIFVVDYFSGVTERVRARITSLDYTIGGWLDRNTVEHRARKDAQ